LLIRPGAIGDFVVSLPALQSLRADYTEVWCPSVVHPLVQFADRVVSIAGSGIDRVGLAEAHDVIRRLSGFDEIHSWYGTNQPEFRETCRGLPFHFYPALPLDGTQQATDFYLGQVGQPAGDAPRLRMEKQPKEQFAILHPFSGSAKKNWPIERWLQLAQQIEPRMRVCWCCGPEDDLPDAVVIPDLLELAQWISRATVFIGNDSGITHLAAAAGTAVIALFGPTDPVIWTPRGSDVKVIHRPFLNQITVEAVAKAIP